ncbi:MAG: GNAT family N-acetyltransferase [Anaerolineaceae bacterium]|nr:GNAT family N-acetyltransferase [Anaerolineaceae bacterium]
MSTPFSLVIRDALQPDIPACLALDHHYETDYVWQMSVIEDVSGREIHFRKQHLPRTMPVQHVAFEPRLHQVLQEQGCFLVAAEKQSRELLGYLVMQRDPIYRTALLQHVVVDFPYRRRGIGKRLLNVARQWAAEQGLDRITIETQTKNYPAIEFCQGAGFTFSGFSDQHFPNQDIALFFTQGIR